MDLHRELSALGAMDLSEAGRVFRSFLQGTVRDSLVNIMAAEVSELCGALHRPKEGEQFRSGSAKGSVLIEGRRVDVKRPRVRQQKADGTTEEVNLATYNAARDPVQLHEHIMTALLAGVSSREQKRLHGAETRGTSKSQVSRLWQQEGAKLLEQFRARTFEEEDWLVLMLDGISLGKDLLAIVALGVTQEGRKVLLDFEIGSSESYAVCKALLNRLVSRGFAAIEGHRLFAITDGSAALRKGILKVFPGTQVQRCLVHKERNLRGYLSKRDWGELNRLCKRLRQAQGDESGREALEELRAFAKGKNASALESVDEAGEDLIRMHLLGVPSTLGATLLSTNHIENPFRNVRKKIGRVQRWRPETNQPSRWLAYALTEAERGFRKVRGYADLPELRKALTEKACAIREAEAEKARAAATPLRATPSAPLQPLTR